MTNSKSVCSLSINPELFRFLAFFTFWIMSGVGVALTLIYNPETLEHNAILTIFGVNNLCVFFDEPPARDVLPTLWPISLFCFLMYFLTSFIQQYQNYQEAQISKLLFSIRSGIIFLGVVAVLFFSTVFAVHPENNIYLHTIPFLFLIVVLTILSLGNLSYYLRIIRFNKWAYYYFVAYNAILILATIIYFAKISIALFSLYDPWILQLVTGSQIDKFWTVLVFVFPLGHTLYFMNKTKRVEIKFNISD